MKRLLFILFTVSILFAKAQQGSDFAQVNLSIPDSATGSTDAIASFINKNLNSAKEKLSAAYTWVTENIQYDTDSMYVFNWGPDPSKRITEALRRRKGVCENYAAIFTDIVLKCGFRSFVVSGYTQQGGSIDRSGHSWCAVYFEGKWYLFDPTWDRSFQSHPNWFFIAPEEFVLTHMPFDPLWQLVSSPVTQEEFEKGSFRRKGKEILNVEDSVNAFLQLNGLQQRESSVRRMAQAGPGNDLLKIWMAYNQMKIGIVYEEQDMQLYNSAVADLNNATTVFNQFVQYRNNEFNPPMPDKEIAVLLEPAIAFTAAAFKKIDSIGRSGKNYQYNTEGLVVRLQELRKRVQEQKDFLLRYLAADYEGRLELFYK